MLNEDLSTDEVKSTSQAELKNMAKDGFQKRFNDLYKGWQKLSTVTQGSYFKKEDMLQQVNWRQDYLAQFHPNLEAEQPGDGQRPPNCLPLLPTLREYLGLFRVPPCRKGTIRPCHLWDSKPGPRAQQSASPTTIPYGWLFIMLQ
ncbi:hypothetical protein TNCV_603551 [Trichonephila clavipes]|nr:hypothetical protein TNCV_603551 [Trichonephila clavipes]